jgi:hypothetical protein
VSEYLERFLYDILYVRELLRIVCAFPRAFKSTALQSKAVLVSQTKISTALILLIGVIYRIDQYMI